jgi:hypothetical protein
MSEPINDIPHGALHGEAAGRDVHVLRVLDGYVQEVLSVGLASALRGG